MGYPKNCLKCLIALGFVTILLLICAYSIVDNIANNSSVFSLKNLGLSIIPNIIATICAAMFALLFAEHLSERNRMQLSVRDSNKKIELLSGSWNLRDWCDDYHVDFTLKILPKKYCRKNSFFFHHS